jgi:galactonate dehydratase
MDFSASSRRNFLSAGFFGSAAAAAAAGMALVRDAGADEPGKNAEDRVTSVKITSMRGLPAGGKCYVKIETSANVTGWGEITGLEPNVAAELVKSLFELLDGENPTRIEYLWQKIFRSHRDMRGGPFMTHTLSAIDMALWDITGKLHGVPVYKLLGGAVRDNIRLYPHAKAFKTSAGGPYPASGTPPEVQNLVKRVEQAREKVGPDGVVMFDAHCCLPPPILIQFAAAIQPHDVFFIEEPAVPGNIEVFKRLKEQIRVPLATGERDHTIWGMVPYLQNNCIDILQPDCGQTGGISQMKKIAALAEAYTVPLAPHCTMSELGLTASLHAIATIPNFLIHEAYLDGHIMPAGVARKNWDVNKDNNALLPQGPGLGVEIDEAAIEKVNADPKKKFKWPKPKLKDGSVTDY